MDNKVDLTETEDNFVLVLSEDMKSTDRYRIRRNLPPNFLKENHGKSFKIGNKEAFREWFPLKEVKSADIRLMDKIKNFL